MRHTAEGLMTRMTLETTINRTLEESEKPDNLNRVYYVRAIRCPTCYRHAVAFGAYPAEWDAPMPQPAHTHLIAKVMNGQILPKHGH